jgi:hypothetical protein
MRTALVSLALAVTLACRIAGGATSPGSMVPNSLLTAESLDRLSVGFDAATIERGIKSNGETGILDARMYSGFVGLDALEWLTLFVTVGSCEVKAGMDDDNLSQGLKWSLGLAPVVWQMSVARPTFMSGTLSLAGLVEYANYRSEEHGTKIEWTDLSAAILIRYEIMEDFPSSKEEPMSLRFFAGPVVSLIDGEVTNPNRSFEQDEDVGLAAGIEWFITPLFCLAGSAELFDEASVTGSLRFHF